jgi:hypothetical protein
VARRALALRVEVDLDQGLLPLLERVALERGEVCARGPWLCDLLARQPELQRSRERAEPLLPVAVECCDDLRAAASTRGARWVLEVREPAASHAGACRFVYDARPRRRRRTRPRCRPASPRCSRAWPRIRSARSPRTT